MRVCKLSPNSGRHSPQTKTRTRTIHPAIRSIIISTSQHLSFAMPHNHHHHHHHHRQLQEEPRTGQERWGEREESAIERMEEVGILWNNNGTMVETRRNEYEPTSSRTCRIPRTRTQTRTQTRIRTQTHIQIHSVWPIPTHLLSLLKSELSGSSAKQTRLTRPNIR